MEQKHIVLAGAGMMGASLAQVYAQAGYRVSLWNGSESGLDRARNLIALNQETLGTPVIAVGVPTVVDAATLAADVLAQAGRADLDPDALRGAGDGLLVTPRDIDARVADLAKVIGYGINLALQPGLSIADIDLFLS